MPLAHETNRLSCATTLVPVARIGVPLLLKTILLHPIAAAGAPTGRIFLSIAVQEFGSNEGGYRELRASLRSRAALKSCISIIGVWDIRFIETSQTDL
jgi:hypothetical protein